jgi:hypothetical protein
MKARMTPIPRARAFWVLLVILPFWSAFAAGARGKARPRTPTPSSSAAPILRPPDVSFNLDEATHHLLERAQVLYETLEFDGLLKVAEHLLGRDDLSSEQRVRAYLLQGSALAVVADPTDAERPFRLLLRIDGNFDISPSTPPKILNVFRKVQVEERTLAEKLKQVRRAKVMEAIHLMNELPQGAPGGVPHRFSLRLKDPTNSIDEVRIAYRTPGDKTFSALALQRDDGGQWTGELPAAITASDKGFDLPYRIEASDAEGPLLTRGTNDAPLVLHFAPGQVARRATPIPPWLFWSTTAATVLGGGVAGASAIAANQAQGEYRSVARGPEVVSGDHLAAIAARGDSFTRITNVALVSSLALAVLSAVFIPFVDWPSPAPP